MAKKVEKFVQATGIDLSNMEDVTLRKIVPEMPAVVSVQDALALLGNSQERLVAVIVRGLWDEHQKAVKKNPEIPWRTVSDEGKINGEFQGTLGDKKKVSDGSLKFAKMAHGYDSAVGAEAKRKAKEAGRETLKQLIASGVVQLAYFLPAEEDEDEAEVETEA